MNGKTANLTPAMEEWATEEHLRDLFPTILVPSSHASRGMIHIPDPDENLPTPDHSTGHDTDAQPVCQRRWSPSSDGWKSKSERCYPPGYKDWCPCCIKLYCEEHLGFEEDEEVLPEYRKETTLRRLYWGEGLSMNDIAERFDTKKRTVRDWIHHHDIETRDPAEYNGTDPEDRADPDRAEVA